MVVCFRRPKPGNEVASAEIMSRRIRLQWQKFTKLTDGRSRFAKIPCVYVQTDAQGCPIRIGKASEGLEARYRGGPAMRLTQRCTVLATSYSLRRSKKNFAGPSRTSRFGKVDIALL